MNLSAVRKVLVRDDRKRPVRMKRIREGVYEAVPTRANGERVWSIQPSSYAAAAFAGIPPVFARRPEDLASLPAGIRTVERLGGSEEADKVYRDGLRGKGIQLNGKDLLTIRTVPPGRRGGLPLSHDEGTVEFWMRPNWDSVLLPYGFRGGMITMEAKQAYFYSFYERRMHVSGRRVWDIVGFFPASNGRRYWARACRHLLWEPGQWVHIALLWHKDRRGRFAWELYVDGYRKRTSQRRMAGGPDKLTLPKDFTTILVGCSRDDERDQALDAVIDDLRISSVARYKGSDSKRFPLPRKMEIDKHTIALFRFEGDTTGRGPRNATYKAQFKNREK
jgi:hypothetical protein